MDGNSAWLSLSAAADLLGVHFTTLRRWADQGLIEHMRTPGGKRRFSQKVIGEFIEQYRSPALAAPHALVQLQDEAINKTRHDLNESGLVHQTWYLRISDEQRMYMRGAGGNLVALMFQYCARDTHDEVYLEKARRITEEYGRICYSTGLTAAECVQVFLLFRRPMLNAVHDTGLLHGSGDADGKRLYGKMTHFLDEVLVAMVAEFNRQSNLFPMDR